MKDKIECRCYGVNKEWGKQHCDIHRFTKDKKTCKHERLSIDRLDKNGKRQCNDCGKYIKREIGKIIVAYDKKKISQIRTLLAHLVIDIHNYGHFLSKENTEMLMEEIKKI